MYLFSLFFQPQSYNNFLNNTSISTNFITIIVHIFIFFCVQKLIIIRVPIYKRINGYRL